MIFLNITFWEFVIKNNLNLLFISYMSTYLWGYEHEYRIWYKYLAKINIKNMLTLIIQLFFYTLNYLNEYNVWTGVGNMWGEEDRMRSYYYAKSRSSSPFWFTFYYIYYPFFPSLSLCLKNFQPCDFSIMRLTCEI